jgi:hypothetical protein
MCVLFLAPENGERPSAIFGDGGHDFNRAGADGLLGGDPGRGGKLSAFKPEPGRRAPFDD